MSDNFLTDYIIFLKRWEIVKPVKM